VLPAFVVRSAGSPTFRSVKSPGKRHKVASVVRDVCADCNNGPLSRLDQSAKEILDEISRLRLVEIIGRPLTLNARLLLRWLLKVSYNESRMSGEQRNEHRPCVGFVLGDRPTPPVPCDLLVGVLTDPPVSIRTRRPLVNVRVGELLLPVLTDQLVLRRLVCVNPWLFAILAWRPGVTRRLRRRVTRSLAKDYRLVPARSSAPLVISGPCPLTATEFFRETPLGARRMLTAARARKRSA
jgi:hypothetical protein